MSDISNRTYRDLAIPYFIEVFKLVDEIMKANQAPYYLIGVTAADIQLLQQGVKPSRGTKDIDFAVMVSSFAAYQKVKEDLILRGFNHAKVPFTLYHAQYNVAIDLLPFGQIEQSDTANFTEREVTMNVLGFRETLEDPKVIPLDNSLSIQVPPLHGMVVLKLISWSDRPEMRATDLDDIYRIVSHYFDTESDTIFGEHFDLLGAEPFDEKMIAAELMGRRIAEILKKSVRVQDRVMNVLEENISDPVKSSIGKYWASKHQIDIDYAISILRSIKKGISERYE